MKGLASMKKLLLIGIGATILLVALSFGTDAFDYMAVLYGIGQAFVNCATFYVVDRYGFRQVDTIERVRNSDALYGLYMVIYASLIVAGFVMGYGLWA